VNRYVRCEPSDGVAHEQGRRALLGAPQPDVRGPIHINTLEVFPTHESVCSPGFSRSEPPAAVAPKRRFGAPRRRKGGTTCKPHRFMVPKCVKSLEAGALHEPDTFRTILRQRT